VAFSLTRQIGKKRLRRHAAVFVVVVVEVFVLAAADIMKLLVADRGA